jgi:hypothetical protein
VEAAHVAIRLPGPARHRYLSLVRRRGKKVAPVAAARTILILDWTLLTRGEVYQRAVQGELALIAGQLLPVFHIGPPAACPI